MADMTQLATLGNLQRVVENMKVYVDSDKTVSIKGYLKENNTYKFYNTSTPTEDTTPIFSFDIATEYFLDQTKTTFVQNFEWSDAIYTGSTNPNLDGKPVFVLAVKGDDTVSYSFVNLETLVQTYKTKNTTTLSLDITDNEISGNVNISTEDGNAVVVKDDGLYVPTTAEIKVSEADGNIIEVKDDGLYVGSGDVVISKEDYDALDEETRNNGQTYFIYDDETTEDGTDLSQFAKVSNLEDGTITVGNSKKLNGLTKDELFVDTNSKIEEINNNLSDIGNVYNTEINITNPTGEWAIGARLELSNGTYIIFRRGYSLTESIIIGKGYSIGDYVSSIAKEQSATYIEVQKIDTPTTICNFIFANSDIYNDISAVRIG